MADVVKARGKVIVTLSPEEVREAVECAAWFSEMMDDAGEKDREIERLREALEKIANRYPCSTADDMARVAREALGLS